MLEAGVLFFIAMSYLGALFALAHWGDVHAVRWRNGPL